VRSRLDFRHSAAIKRECVAWIVFAGVTERICAGAGMRWIDGERGPLCTYGEREGSRGLSLYVAGLTA